MAGWHVEIEVVLLSIDVQRRLSYRTRTQPLTAGTAPDEAALELAGPAGREAGAVSHSTSWRCPDPGRLVLTYAVLPDPEPAGAAALVAPSIVCSGDPLRPTPPDLHGHHVAAHAVRHLAYLAGTDPAVTAATREHPELWLAIGAAAAEVPVAEHGDAHALARTRRPPATAPVR